MKMRYTHKWLGLLLMTISILSCADKKSGSAETEHSQTEKKNTHNDMEGVMLTAQQFEALQMEIDTLQMHKMDGFVETNGRLEVPPQNEASITSVVGANVVSIEVIEGDEVAKGQTVAYLSHPNIIDKQTQFLNAYSNSNYLKKEYARQKILYDEGVGSGATYQKAEAAYQASKAKANGLKAQLGQLNINAEGVKNGTIYQRVPLRSPIAGFVEKVMVKTGQYVEPQSNLMEVVDTHHVHADLMVFEKDVYKVENGQKVRFSVQSIPNTELTASIYSVGKTFEQNPKALHVHAEIENKQGNLIPGMYIQGRIQIDSTTTLAFPESAIVTDGDRTFVFKAEQQGQDWRFSPVEVNKGAKDGEWFAVRFLKTEAPGTKYAMNNTYYLIAEMKKGEAGH